MVERFTSSAVRSVAVGASTPKLKGAPLNTGPESLDGDLSASLHGLYAETNVLDAVLLQLLGVIPELLLQLRAIDLPFEAQLRAHRRVLPYEVVGAYLVCAVGRSAAVPATVEARGRRP